MHTIRSIALALAACVVAASARADVVVVVHPHNPVAGMTAEQVTQIYTGASTTFPGGAAATPIDQPEGSAVRTEFLAKVLDKSDSQFKAIWSRLIFSGKGTRPRTLGSSAEVKKAVAADPAAIGFIERSALDNSVKPVLEAK
jgi:ABC-type phosphate transport system substrate-binding protein